MQNDCLLEGIVEGGGGLSASRLREMIAIF